MGVLLALNLLECLIVELDIKIEFAKARIHPGLIEGFSFTIAKNEI